MNNLYIDDEWYLCILSEVIIALLDKDNITQWYNSWLSTRKYKVNSQGLFEEVI